MIQFKMFMIVSLEIVGIGNKNFNQLLMSNENVKL
jgi:hypothetical protein